MSTSTAINTAPDIVSYAKRWMIETCLPLWASAGVDWERGGFHERLNADASPDLTASKRLRVQARQIFVYAMAEHLGWFPGKAVAVRGFEYVLSKGRSPDGLPGFVHLLLPDGGVADAKRDSTDHDFVLLALCWLARITGDSQIRAVLDETLDFIKEHLSAPDGSLLEGIPHSLPRRQIPQMHAFEAALAMHESLNYPGSLERAAFFHDLMVQHFVDPATGTLGEYYGENWTRNAVWKSHVILPGLQAEWCWMIRRYERLAGLPASPLASQLLDHAVSLSDASGLLLDEADRDLKVLAASKRSWPQTELAKAWIGEAEANRTGAKEKATHALKALFSHYMDKPRPGMWLDQLNSDGNSVKGPVSASTLYHIIVAIAEADRVLGD